MQRILRWRRLAVACGAMLLGASLVGEPNLRASVITDNPSAWNQTFGDDFDGSSLDADKWAYRLSGPRHNAVNTPSAVSVGGGLLTIKTYTDAGTHYTGMIGTRDLSAQKDLFAQAYGYFEARMKFQSSPGQWSAFWLTSPIYDGNVGNPGLYGTEIDVVEHRKVNGSDAEFANRYVSAVHWDGYGAEHQQTAKTVGPLAAMGNGSWHTYGLRWSPEGYDFYFDDILKFNVTQAISARPEYMILSSEVRDANWAGTVPASGYGTLATSTTNVQVDYVRAYAMVPEPTGVALMLIAAAGMMSRRKR